MSVYHLTIWRDVINRVFGHKTHYLCAKSEAGEMVGILPLVQLKSRLFGNYLVSMPFFNYGGAVGLSVEIEDALMKDAVTLAKAQGCGHIEFRDNTNRVSEWRVRTDKVILELPLPASTEILWSSLSSKLRTKIRRPQKEGAEVIHGRHELLSDFYHVFARNMRDLGTPVYPKVLFHSILNALPQSASVVVIRLGGQPVAAGFLLGFKDRLEVPWASSVREFNRLKINMLLYWELLKAAVEGGYKVFDFGRSTISSGTFDFKKQWGAEARQLYWHYWLSQGVAMPQLTPDNPKYRSPIRTWQHLPLFLTNWLGPRIVKNLP
jgi:FemAB-related protein (PEP-CTERM system-associated)